MTDAGIWMSRLEAEVARELGQPVVISPGGVLPAEDRCWQYTLEVPGSRLTLAVDAGELAGILVEGRLIEAAAGDEEMVRELWTGILTGVCGRLGGRAADGSPSRERDMRGAMAACSLRLGSATLRMGLAIEEMGAHSAAPGGNYDLLLEVELDASVRFGSREMELRELLELGPGDVVELDRLVSDAVDLIVGDRIVARGEVVLVNGNFGLRVTQLAEPTRRLESIRCL